MVQSESVARQAFTVPQVDLGDPRDWLAAGWRDCMRTPGISFSYGFVFFAIGWAIVGTLVFFDVTWMMLPLAAGFMLVGPIMAVGLYEVSRRLARDEHVTVMSAMFVRTRSPGQIVFTGVLLMVLVLMWMRVAMINYALFFGLRPFPGLAESMRQLFLTGDGLAMLAIGTLVGGLFAVLAFAISAFSIPMMVVRDVDAVTAMVRSVQVMRHNPRAMFLWGMKIAILTGIGMITGFLGMIVVFPLLGHATWHAYQSVLGHASPSDA